ncbi:class F sortase [Micromonospora sp. WMMA1363]|uniref:class F sortase n=1 Tax=Micromonospora sp. WMMA1363 TaxID=3053985 RepID=UPI00259C6B95|nr:class F sortase [Micromonospora sp. WMMA1363]MDM4720402.1 class F sortase [Micromonospora sp. WMMA1363]
MTKAHRHSRSGPGRAATRWAVRSSARLARATARRLRRVAGQTVAASLATTDPTDGPLPARPPRRRWTATGRRPAPSRNPGVPVLVIGTLMVLIIAMLAVERVTGTSVLPDRFTAGLRPPPKEFPVLPASRPVAIQIDTIDVAAPVHTVGLASDGTIAAPDAARAEEAGWYDQGPTPGQYGPAVIVGHVDTSTGPAIFHGLRSLRAGDRVEVARSDGTVAVFEVNSVERFDKQRFPADQVFGDFSRPNLRLVTCGGRWVGGETGYADNVVVFASLVRAHGG